MLSAFHCGDCGPVAGVVAGGVDCACNRLEIQTMPTTLRRSHISALIDASLRAIASIHGTQPDRADSGQQIAQPGPAVYPTPNAAPRSIAPAPQAPPDSMLHVRTRPRLLSLYKTALFEHLQMLHYRRKCHIERISQARNGNRPLADPLHHRAARRIAQRVEDSVDIATLSAQVPRPVFPAAYAIRPHAFPGHPRTRNTLPEK